MKEFDHIDELLLRQAEINRMQKIGIRFFLAFFTLTIVSCIVIAIVTP